MTSLNFKFTEFDEFNVNYGKTRISALKLSDIPACYWLSLELTVIQVTALYCSGPYILKWFAVMTRKGLLTKLDLRLVPVGLLTKVCMQQLLPVLGLSR